MSWRGLPLLLACAAAALAQLPRSQAPMPNDAEAAGAPPIKLDAVVTDLEGRPIADMKANDFTLEVDGKPRKIELCDFRADQPLRLAVVIDDLAMSLERLNAARRVLRSFVTETLRAGDEMAILRTNGGAGALDRFTADKDALQRAIDRARFVPGEPPTVDSFGAGALNVLAGAMEGMREIPGRKALLLVSEGVTSVAGADRLTKPAHRAATAFYLFDAAPAAASPARDTGVAIAARETGGRQFDSDLAGALGRIAQEQRNYYLLTYRAEDIPFDYLTRGPRIESVSLKATRAGASARARNGVPGDPEEREVGFSDAIDADLAGDGLRTKLTAMLSMGTGWQIETVMHLDARDVTFVKGVDGLYRATLDTSTALFDHEGHAAKEVTRSFEAQLGETSFRRYQEYGFDYTVVLPVPREGAYHVRAAVRDTPSGRVGSARQFVRVPGVKDGLLAMSSIVVRGEIEKTADGLEAAKDPLESGSIRSFKTGRRVTYAYNLFNVSADAEKKSRVETRSEIWRDGVRVYAAEPKTIEFPASDAAGRRSVSGTLAISDGMVPGAYVLRIVVTDTMTGRAAAQTMDFDVRP